MISDDTLSKSLSDGVDLGSESWTSDSDSNIEVSESLSSEEKDRLINLSLEELWVNKIDGRSINLKESLSGSNGSNGNGIFLSAEGLHQLGLLLLLTHLYLIADLRFFYFLYLISRFICILSFSLNAWRRPSFIPSPLQVFLLTFVLDLPLFLCN